VVGVTSNVEVNHLAGPPTFEYEPGQSFKLEGEVDPQEYWYVEARVWNYDADTDDALVQARAFKQYLIAEVSTLGGGERLVTEDTLVMHYETVPQDEAKEVLEQ
jgi:hypothetical protein